MFYENKKENFIKYVIFFLLIIIIFMLWIMVMKIDYTNQNIAGNYKTEKLDRQTSENDGKSSAEIENLEKEELIDLVEDEKKNRENMIEKVSKSVVGISKIKQNDASVFIEDSEVKLGLGSGVIISENGYILSNAHVVGSKYSNCFVTLENGKNYTADVVWVDENIDLAIIKILA